MVPRTPSAVKRSRLVPVTTEPVTRHTYAEYLALESESPVRHEFVDGEICAMAGGTLEHSQIAANVIGHLRAALHARPCVVYTSDARVKVDATSMATYPDVGVVCGEVQRSAADKDAITNPIVIVEVLSDSTSDWDRGGKFDHYRRLASLREYVLVSQTERAVEHRVRNDDGSWTVRYFAARDAVTLASLECELPLDEVYFKVAGL